jgi:N-acetylglucosaminyldiphosphoundecaprenol N-acetyl-beta-D-mannosaminyltransferase
MQECLGVSFAPCSMDQLVDNLARRPVPEGHGPYTIFTANLDHVVRIRQDEQFREAYSRATIVTADGAPVYAYAKLRGAQVSKIAGADLFARLMSELDPAEHRCFFVLSSDKLGKGMVSHLVERGFPRDQLAHIAPPFGFEKDEAVSAELAEAIVRFRPTHLFFCVGAPKSEIWCDQHADQIGDAYVLCAGASVEFYLGTKQRAPLFMRQAGLEWLWRWTQEPSRLWRRYFVDSWGFLHAIHDDLRR